MGMCDRICVEWPRARISLIRGCPRFFSFAMVEGGRMERFGKLGFGGATGWLGERKDSRQAIRGVAIVVVMLGVE